MPYNLRSIVTLLSVCDAFIRKDAIETVGGIISYADHVILALKINTHPASSFLSQFPSFSSSPLTVGGSRTSYYKHAHSELFLFALSLFLETKLLRQFRFYIQKSLRGRTYRLYSHTIHTRSINPTKKQQLTIREKYATKPNQNL